MSKLRSDGSVVGYQDPAFDAVEIAASDGADLASVTRGIYVGVGGDLKATLAGGTTVTFVNLADGCLLPVQASKVFATGTTASALVGLL